MLSAPAALGPTALTPSVRSHPSLPRLRVLSATLLKECEANHLGAPRLAIPVTSNLLDTDRGRAAHQISKLACSPGNAGKHDGIRSPLNPYVSKATTGVY